MRHRYRVQVQEQGGFLERERLHRRADNGNWTRANDSSLRKSFALVVIVFFEVIETASDQWPAAAVALQTLLGRQIEFDAAFKAAIKAGVKLWLFHGGGPVCRLMMVELKRGGAQCCTNTRRGRDICLDLHSPPFVPFDPLASLGPVPTQRLGAHREKRVGFRECQWAMAHAAIVGTGTPVRQWGEDLFEQKRGVIFRG